MRRKLTVPFLCLFLMLLAGTSAAQTNFFQFKILESGIYRISSQQAAGLGFEELSQVAIFGFPGMLPQKLGPEQLELQEIPALEKDGNLFFFLNGANDVTFSEERLVYSHHLFTDSLSYILGEKENPKRINLTLGTTKATNPDQIWYAFTTHKEEITNILNSGRTWYSSPIRQGQSLNINLGLRSTSDQPWILQGRLMAQSFSSSTMRVLTGNDLLTEVEFAPIPNSTYGIKGRESDFVLMIKPGNQAIPQLRFTFQGSGSESAGYLDHVVVGVPIANSSLAEGIFHAKQSASIPLFAQFDTWEVSDFYNPIAYQNTAGASADGKKWVIFSQEKVPEIKDLSIASMDLRNSADSPELLIITSPLLISSANKLRDHKLSMGLDVQVATTTEIYENFGYGNQDLTAIRNFIAHTYQVGKNLKNVLILGKGTFDYKTKLGGRPNLVPIYSSRESLNPLTTFSSDDFFGLIDWEQGEWEESREGDEPMQIGIGRLPAINFAEANEMVEKIIRYETNPIRSPEAATITFLADDADNNIHVRDAEAHAKFLTENHPEFQLSKLYLDRFEQEKTGSIQRSPQAKAALEKTIDEGTLILNYIGHGNETTLTAEEIFQVADITDWAQQENPALWVTATCEFGRHDSPFIRSAAEELLFAAEKGAVALLTTGRPVFSSVNFALNEAFINEVFKKNEGQFQSLGEIFKNTKNQSLNGSLNRNFSLLGDPSLKLAIPELEVKVTSIQDAIEGSQADTLKSLQEVVLKAEIIDPLTQAFQPGFNGDFQLEIRDKPVTEKTLGDESTPFEFDEEKNLIFKGRGKVESGVLEARFFIPKEINPEFGAGSLRIRAWDTQTQLQAMGSSKPILGGKLESEPNDQTGPEILPKLNGQASGPFVFPTPTLEIEAALFDESGINISGYVPGQDLSIQLNGQNPILLNQRYSAKNGSFQEGEFKISLEGFVEGKNTIIIRAWDNVGNESTLEMEVEIRGSRTLKITEHTVYPNPATSESNFLIRHNRPGENLNLSLAVYSLTGQILFSESFRLLRAEEIIDDLSWIFLQSQSKYPAKGTYIYKLDIYSESDLTSDSVSGKIVIQ
ncbi:type IX secretion system sortase PorU [Algoriphagus litoralis]|uniref:type IX secretion system sortase PorU n=1 Tax=Algoriphagus litoralis TaxID=2202829 RepID=UPI000DB9D230|nr:type IX secretion system sortase PorU [Algoriphagus litoralis]